MITAILLASWLSITATRPITDEDLQQPQAFSPPTSEDMALILSFLDHSDRRIRSEAAWAIGDSGLPALNAHLAERLSRETNEWVRADIVHAMGKLNEFDGKTRAKEEDPAAIWKLLQLSDPDPNVRRWSVWAIGEWKAAAAVSAVADRARKDESEIVRIVAAETLGKLGGQQAEIALTEAMNDPSPRVRQAAAAALGTFFEHHEEGVRALLAALKDTDPLVRAAAVGSLGNVNTFKVDGPVAEMASDDFAFVRKQVAASLRRLEATEHVLTTIRLLADSDMSVRMEAAQTLGSFHDEKAISPMVARLSDPDKFVRRAVSKGLVALQMADQIVPKLVAQLKNEAAEVRREAAWALGEYRDKRGTIPLAWIVRDPDFQTSLNAIEALGKVGDPLAVDELLYQLKNRSAPKRAMSAWSLGEIGDKRATNAMIPLLTDSDFEPRLETAIAAGKIRDARFVEPLIKVLHNVTSERYATRAAAAWSLGYLGDARAVRRFQQMVAEKVIPTPFGPVYDHEAVRMNSVVALTRIARTPGNEGQLARTIGFLEAQFQKTEELSDNLKKCMSECLYALTGKEYRFDPRVPPAKQYFVRSMKEKN